MERLRCALAAALALAGAACGDDEEAAAPSVRPTAPLVDACGPLEVPLVGGGCRAVGPSATCWEGWAPDDVVGCAPILPAEPCAPGEIALPGDAACQPLAACGSGTWGDVEIEPDAVHVDAAYTGADSDGTSAKPFSLLEAALLSSSGRRQVVLAAGEYVGDVIIAKGQRVVGRCPELVTIVGDDASNAAVVFDLQAGELHSLTVTGPGAGIGVLPGKHVLLDSVVVSECGSVGIQLGADATVRRSILEKNIGVNLLVLDGVARVEASALRDGLVNAADQGGYGAQVGDLGDATFVDTVFERNRHFGLLVSTHSALERVVVQDTLGDEKTGGQGIGMTVQPADDGTPARVEIKQSSFARNQHSGVVFLGSIGVLDEVIVQDTKPMQNGFIYTFGEGLQAIRHGATGSRSSLDVRRSSIVGNHEGGLVVVGSTALIEDVLVRDSRARPWDRAGGVGVLVHDDWVDAVASDAKVNGLRVDQSAEGGVYVVGSTVEMKDVLVDETAGALDGASDGRGLVVQSSRLTGNAAQASLSGVVVRNSRAVGIFVSGATVDAADVVVEDTFARGVDGELGDGIAASGSAESGLPTLLSLQSAWIARAARAGVLFSNAQGTVSASGIVDSRWALALELGAAPQIAADVGFHGNAFDRIERGAGLAAPRATDPLQP